MKTCDVRYETKKGDLRRWRGSKSIFVVTEVCCNKIICDIFYLELRCYDTGYYCDAIAVASDLIASGNI